MLGGKTGVPYSCRETGPLEEGCKNPLLWKNGNTWLLLHVFATALKKKTTCLIAEVGHTANHWSHAGHSFPPPELPRKDHFQDPGGETEQGELGCW